MGRDRDGRPRAGPRCLRRRAARARHALRRPERHPERHAGGASRTPELVKEVGGAVAFLRRRRGVDARRLAIVGSSVGASTAVLAMTGPGRRWLRAAVALSPPAAPALDALMERRRYHPRNVLFARSTDCRRAFWC